MKCADEPPASLKREIVALGEAARPVLLELLTGAFAESDGGREGYESARAWAATHLGTFPPDDATIRALVAEAERDPKGGDDPLVPDAALFALSDLGAAAVPALLASLRREPAGTAAHSRIAEALSSCKVQSSEVLAALAGRMERDPLTATYLAEYGDPAALPALTAALDRYVWAEEISIRCDQDVIDLCDAVESLGGELTPAQREMPERVTRRRRRAFREMGYDPDNPNSVRAAVAGMVWTRRWRADDEDDEDDFDDGFVNEVDDDDEDPFEIESDDDFDRAAGVGGDDADEDDVFEDDGLEDDGLEDDEAEPADEIDEILADDADARGIPNRVIEDVPSEDGAKPPENLRPE